MKINEGETEKQSIKAKILKERAKKLAEVPKKTQKENVIEILEFMIGEEKYGIETKYIKGVFPLKEITFIPSVSDFIKGITNLRGEFFLVIDLKKLFNFKSKELPDQAKVIVLCGEKKNFSILTDSILIISIVSLSELQKLPQTFPDEVKEYIIGLTKENTQVLNIAKLLQDESYYK